MGFPTRKPLGHHGEVSWEVRRSTPPFLLVLGQVKGSQVKAAALCNCFLFVLGQLKGAQVAWLLL